MPTATIHPSHQPAARRTLIALAILAVLWLALLAQPPVLPPPGLPLQIGLETLGIVFATLIFAVVWSAPSAATSRNACILAGTFLGVALLSFTHLLSHPAMPGFVTPGSVEQAINFWLAAQLLTAAGLLAALWLPWQQASQSRRWPKLLAVLALVAVLHAWLLWAPHTVPRTYIDGIGPTPFKQALEALLIGLYLLAVLRLLWLWRQPRTFNVSGLLGAAVTMAMGVVLFAQYVGASELFCVRDHLFKILSYFFFYRALFVETLLAPHKALQARSLELEQSRANLEREHLRLHNALAGTRAATWEWQAASGALQVDARWTEMLGYRREELPPVRHIAAWKALIHPEDRATFEQRLQQHLQGQQAHFDCEIRLRQRSGDWLWVHVRGIAQGQTADGCGAQWVCGTQIDISERKQAQAEREALMQQLNDLAANLPGALFSYRHDPEGRHHCDYLSQRAEELCGLAREQLQHDVNRLFARLRTRERLGLQRAIDESARTLGPFRTTFRLPHPERGLRWIEVHAAPHRLPDGGTLWHGYAHDVTRSHHDQEQLLLADKVFEASQSGIFVADSARRIVKVNPAFSEITGYRAHDVLGRSPRLLGSGRHDATFFSRMLDQLKRSGRWQGEVWNRRQSGELYAQWLAASCIRNDADEITHYLAVFTDISGLKAHEQQLDHLANHDMLTGLPNRRLLHDRLQQAIAYCQRNDTSLALALLDLDGFKPVNDEHGHAVGDKLLAELAQRLRQVVRADETVARLGGDEFVLLFRENHGPLPLERVLQTVREPMQIDGLRLQVGASVGVTRLRADNASPEQLLLEADHAMYQAKSGGRNRFEFFDPAGAPAFYIPAGHDAQGTQGTQGTEGDVAETGQEGAAEGKAKPPGDNPG